MSKRGFIDKCDSHITACHDLFCDDECPFKGDVKEIQEAIWKVDKFLKQHKLTITIGTPLQEKHFQIVSHRDD